MFFIFSTICFAQNSSDLIYVDSSGRMRWSANDEEAYFFGVNYSTPFAFAHRALKNKGISHKEIIDLDIQQFKRLRLNAYRIHVWDREVSDRDGNLLDNEHIGLLDYLISKLIENDIYIILTPIAWWGTGWPEPDIETPGFSTFYSKIESTTKPEVLTVHINYLKQFVNHKNTYTGNTYKDEEYILAFEIFNEPHLPADAEKVRHYINTTVNSLREEEITKPIFFNISQNPGKEQWEGVASSNIQGITFQWYPTGLVKYNELKGNFLPNVLSYPLPDYTDKVKNKAKMVYEFDAADVGKSYIYPVMAHSFKETGMQWATMFSYDPSAIAQYNSEYSTHFLNLLYTPQKALSFLIAGYLFNNEKISDKKIDSSSVIMENVLVDYNSDLSILNNSERFYYTNNTTISPVDVNQLKHIAGYGNSQFIEYNGRGAYFLDKINDDLWSLELYPDAVWVKDPFGRNGLDNPVAKLIWKNHKMKILLPGFNNSFKIHKNYKDEHQTAVDFSVNIEPGIYFISNSENFDIKKQEAGIVDFEMIKKYGEFIENFPSTEIKNLTPSAFYENEEKKIIVELYSKEENALAFLYIRKPGWRNYRKFKMIQRDDFIYELELPSEISSNGKMNYFITINQAENVLTFPGKLNITPEYWAFNPDDSYKISIFPASKRVTIYEPEEDTDNLIVSNIWRYAEYAIDYSFDENNETELNINVRNVKEEFPELAMQIYVGDNLKNINPEYYNKLEFEIKKTSEGPDKILIRPIFNNTAGFEKEVILKSGYEKITITISHLEEFKYALLPRPYPAFLPYWFESVPQKNNDSKNQKLEFVQISIPLPEPGKELNDYGIKLRKISLVKNFEERTSNNGTE